MTREQHEMSEAEHYAQFGNEPGIDKDGFYPGQKKWLKQHPEYDKPVDGKKLKRLERELLNDINPAFGTIQPFSPFVEQVGSHRTSATSRKVSL